MNSRRRVNSTVRLLIAMRRSARIRGYMVLGLLFLPANGFAQELPPLVKRLEKMFAQTEPRWKLQRPYVQSNPPVMHLKSAQGDALIYVFITQSDKAASELFEGGTIAFGNTMGAHGRKTVLPKFADQNYIFTGFVVGGTTSIHFRQGNVYIEVIAPTQVTTKRFAQRILDEIRSETTSRQRAQSNKSLDASGGSAFRIMTGSAMG